MLSCSFFFQAEDGIRGAQESRGLGDVYKRQFRGRRRILLQHLVHDGGERAGERLLAGEELVEDDLSLIHI